MIILGLMLLVIVILYLVVIVLAFQYFVFPWYLLPIICGGLVLGIGGVNFAIWLENKYQQRRNLGG